MAIQKGAEPFLYVGGDKGVLLVHGFTGSPAEMRLLGENLHQRGYTVLGPRLPGHGTKVEDMMDIPRQQWYEAVEDGYQMLRGICREVYVVGLSMGGLLTLKLAAEHKPEKIVCLSTPLFIAHKNLHLLPLYRVFRTMVPKRRRNYDVDPSYLVHYEHTPLKPLSRLLELIEEVKGLLHTIHVPTLLIHSRIEHTAKPESSQEIYDRVASRVKKLVWLEHSGHVVTLDKERQRVFEDIAGFLEEPVQL